MSKVIQEIRNGSKHGPVKSYISGSNVEALNPFVLWDHFHIPYTETNAGFGFHGHSGVATISYPLTGDIDHEDTGGHSGLLSAGGVQVMSAGGGVLHKETVIPDNKVAEAFQLWVVLPEDSQELGPVTYSTAQQDALPVIRQDGSVTKVIAGEFQGVASSVKTPVDMTYLHVRLEPQMSWRHLVAADESSAFIFVRSGELRSGDAKLRAGDFGIYGAGGEVVDVSTAGQSAEFVLVSGAPLQQPIISTGSSVHSSHDNTALGEQRIRQLHSQRQTKQASEA